MGGWLRILLILRLSQPSLAGVGTGAELGNNYFNFLNFLLSWVGGLVGGLVVMNYADIKAISAQLSWSWGWG